MGQELRLVLPLLRVVYIVTVSVLISGNLVAAENFGCRFNNTQKIAKYTTSREKFRFCGRGTNYSPLPGTRL